MIEIIDYLEEILPNASCELLYKKDYEFLIAIMLSAQTTDKKVNQVTPVLFNKYKNLKELKTAKKEEIAQIIRILGTQNIKAKNIIIIATILEKYQTVPNDRKLLESLPGIGRKTTNLFLANIYNEPYMAVDTHISRVTKRLNLVKETDDVLKIEKKLIKLIPKEKITKLHHQLVLFGRYYCTAKNPKCTDCGLKKLCQYKIK